MFKFPDRMQDGRFQRANPGRSTTRPTPSLHTRALAWLIGLPLLGAFFSSELVCDLLAGVGQCAFDLLEDNVETFYRKFAHLELHQAQMAAAYTYSVVLLILGLTLGRRFLRFVRRLMTTLRGTYQRSAEKIQVTYQTQSIFLKTWWDSLDGLNKVAVIVGGIVGVIPVFVLLSYGLGMTVGLML